MITLLAATALASSVTLQVGVHVDAGTIYGVAADGAAGLCAAGPSWVDCPADGPVTFRWGPGDPSWVLAGDTVLQPGDEGRAFVLASDEARTDALARLASEDLTDVEVRGLFVAEGGVEPPVPSAGMLEALYALSDHPDFRVRRAAVEGLHRLCWTSDAGPFPADAPCPIPEGLLDRLSRDKDKGVRRRTAILVRDLRPCHLDDEAVRVLLHLGTDPVRGVKRAAIISTDRASGAGLLTVEEAWTEALQGAAQPGPAGRGAANTLARLAMRAEPSEVIVPSEALAVVLRYNTERAWLLWTAWRDALPFQRPQADVLLRETVGYSPMLVQTWALQDPEGLAAALHDWEPRTPHSERFALVARAIGEAATEEAPLDPVLAPILEHAAPAPDPSEAR